MKGIIALYDLINEALQAFRENKTIGSLAWLFHVQKPGTIVRPEDHLLHYPRHHRGILNFDKHVMTISNYSDDARAYLKKLITLMGGTFTPEMNQQNTIVIAALCASASSWACFLC